MRARLANLTGRKGFTLIEAALATVIIGTGVVALLQLLAAGSMSTRESQKQTVALNLAQNVHEMTLGMSFADPTSPTHWGAEAGEASAAAYDDLDDLSGKTFSPPLDARRQPITTLTGWSQEVTVHTVDPDRMTVEVPNGTAPAVRVTVKVVHNGRTVCEQSWLAFDTQ